MLDDLTAQASPTLRDGFGIGADSAAELLIVFGDNPERVRSEAAYAKLCGTCPIPASSAQTNRHRLYRGGHRQANAALYRVAIVRMRFHQPTIDYVARRTAQGLSKKDIIRLPETLPRPRGLPTRHDRPQNPTTHHPLNPKFDYRGVNTVAESFFATLETELLDRNTYHTRTEARTAVFDFIESWYNPARRHSTLGYQSPTNYERATPTTH